MKAVKDACVPSDSVFNFSAAEQVEDIDALQDGALDAEAFFARTHLTSGLRRLFHGVMNRLNGGSSQALFELTQAMGGGKTHLMLASGLAVQNPSVGQQVLREMDSDLPAPEGVNLAVFTGRREPKGYIWGDIARQLGKEEKFAHLSGQHPEAPDIDNWRNLIGDEPTLILLDELPPYLVNAATKRVGEGTLATVTERALANLFSVAPSLRKCCVVIANLRGTYQEAASELTKQLSHAEEASASRDIDNLQNEARRSSQSITPVSLQSDEIYKILRKRLLDALPDEEEIERIADAYVKKHDEAERSGYIGATAREGFAEDVREAYPFHPGLKHLIALFRDNEGFRQTRGVMQFAARMLKCVWERDAHDVFLVGTQHLDLNDKEVQEEILAIRPEIESAISKDVEDRGNAHAEAIDADLGGEAARQVARLILSSSLSRSVNATVGLSENELLTYLVDPHRDAEEFSKAFRQLVGRAWYIHKTDGERHYFREVENINKRLEDEAKGFPEDKVDKELRKQLEEIFAPSRKDVFQSVQVMPTIDEINVGRERTLIVANPDGKVPPEEIRRFFEEGLTRKNNLLVVSSGDTHFTDRVRQCLRGWMAAQKIAGSLPETHAMRQEANEAVENAKTGFLQAVEAAFNVVFYPTRQGLSQHKTTFRFREGKAAVEDQLRQILSGTDTGVKLKTDFEDNPEPIWAQIERRYWPTQERRARWADVVYACETNPGAPWLPGSRGLETLKNLALQKGHWRQSSEEGFIEKGPFPKERTSVSVGEVAYDDDTGEATLALTPQNAGPKAQVHYADHENVSTEDPVVGDMDAFRTKAARMWFLAVDPSGEYETGEPKKWENKLHIRHEVRNDVEGRKVELMVVPDGEIRYTTDGTNAREGTVYEGPFSVGREGLNLEVFASFQGIETRRSFRIPPAHEGDGEVVIDDTAPLTLRDRIDLGTTDVVFAALGEVKGDDATHFSGVQVVVESGTGSLRMSGDSDLGMTAAQIERAIEHLRDLVGEHAAAATVALRNGGRFSTGAAFKRFANRASYVPKGANIEQ